MRWKIKLHKKVAKFLKEHQDKVFLKNVANAFDKLAENPWHKELNIKKFRGSSSDFRLKIGKYRFIYTVLKEEILVYIYKAGPRGDVYKK
jgi:mRNA interferase RelE/StbE